MKTYNDNDHNNHEFEGGGGGGRGRGGGGDEGEEGWDYYYYSGGWRLLLRLLGRQRGRAERLEVLVTAGGSASKSPLPSASPTFPLLSRLSPRLASLCLPPTSSHNCVLVPARLLPLPGTRHCFRHRLDACSSTAYACLYSRTHARALSADESCFRLHLQKLPTWTRLGGPTAVCEIELCNYKAQGTKFDIACRSSYLPCSATTHPGLSH